MMCFVIFNKILQGTQRRAYARLEVNSTVIAEQKSKWYHKIDNYIHG